MITRPSDFMVLLGVLVAGCKGERPTGGDDPIEPPAPSCLADDECFALAEICDAGQCVPGDRDDAIEDATELLLSVDTEESLAGVIWPEGDVDHYAYVTEGPQWVSVRTIADGDTGLDTVVSILDPDGQLHAYMDDFPVWPYGINGFDTVLYAFLPTAGTWTIAVEDLTSFLDPSDGQADPTFTYDVLIRAASGTTEPDTLADPRSNMDVTGGTSVWNVGIHLQDPGDADFVSVDLSFVEGPVEVWGQYGLEGSTANPRVILHQDGQILADKTGLDDTTWLSWLPAQPGSLVLEATDADGAGGEDVWFMAYVRTYEADASHPFFGTNLYEPEEEPNDVPAGALILTADEEIDDNNETYDAFRLQGGVDVAADVDRYYADAEAGDDVSVRCWTDTFGSLADISVEILDPATALATGEAPDSSQYYVRDVIVTTSGPLEVVVRGDGTASGPGHWYRCAVFVRP